MKILITVDPELPVPPRLYGGIERVVDSLVRELRRRGEVIALLSHPESKCRADVNASWTVTRSGGLMNSVRSASLLRRVSRDFEPDLIHSFSRLAYLLGVARSRTPKIMSYQRSPSRRTVASATRLMRSLTFTGCSEYIANLGRNAGGEWTAVHNFVDLDRYTFVRSVAAEAPLVFLSRVERIKGAHTAIEIARRSGRRLVIAGNHGTSGEDGLYWKTEIEPHLGRDGIEYLGPVDDQQKNALLGSAAAMLVPIEWDEPFGIVFAEALACGTPIISAPRGSLPEIVEDGRHGFLVSSVEEGVSAVARVAAIDRAACRARFEQAFSSPHIGDQYLALYRRMLAEHAVASPEARPAP